MENYTVQAGDTLNKIANKYGYKNYKDAGLVAKSGNPDLIRPGEVYSINPSATNPRDVYASSIASSGPSMPDPNAVSNDVPEAGPAKTDYLKTYRDYLSKYAGSLTEDPEVTAAQQNLIGIQNKGDEQSLAARKAYEDLIHQSGPTKGGALEAGSISNRNNAYILANLGVAESGAARKLGALSDEQTAKQNYYKTLLDASSPVSVGDQTIDPTTGEVIYTKPQSISDQFGTGTIGEYNFAKSQGYKGSFTDYQNEDANRKKSIAAAGVSSQAGALGEPRSPYQTERDTRTLQSVDELYKLADASPGIFGRSAALPIPDFLRSDAYRNFEAQLDTLKANITFGELTAMREASKTGGALGQVSDKENQKLEAALGALSLKQTPEAFKSQLDKIKASIERWNTALAQEGKAGQTSGGNSYTIIKK